MFGRLETLRVAEKIAALTGADAPLLAAIRMALEPLEHSVWPDTAWRFSRLTSSHHPVEFGFSTHEDRLRVTLEVAGPETPDHDRLDAALRLLSALGVPAPPARCVASWKSLQADGSLRWGCWLGLRQTSRGFAAKLYVEAPRGATAAPWSNRVAGARLRMLGHDPASGRTELYFALPAMAAAEVAARLSGFGLADADGMLDALASVIGLPLAAAALWPRLGASVCDDPGDAAFFLNSKSVTGGGEAVRRRMLAGASTGYAALFGPPSTAVAPDHGVLTLTPRARGVELRVGIAADALEQDDFRRNRPKSESCSRNKNVEPDLSVRPVPCVRIRL